MVKKSNYYQLYINVFLFLLIILTISSCFYNENNKLTKKVETNRTLEKNKKDFDDKKVLLSKNPNKEKINKEKFLDWSMYNPPIDNGYTPEWWNNRFIGKRSNINIDSIYNPFGYSNRNQSFYEQGWYPNMRLPPQVIGCGGRNIPCLGGTQETIPVINSPVEISERNIAPINILSHSVDPDPVGVLRQVGVLYKIFGSLNEIYPLYGVKRYRNSDTWDYSTKIGKEGNFVHIKVLTKRVNNNELQTNDEVRIDGNSARFRVTMYDKDFPQYVPYIRG